MALVGKSQGTQTCSRAKLLPHLLLNPEFPEVQRMWHSAIPVFGRLPLAKLSGDLCIVSAKIQTDLPFVPTTYRYLNTRYVNRSRARQCPLDSRKMALLALNYAGALCGKAISAARVAAVIQLLAGQH